MFNNHNHPTKPSKIKIVMEKIAHLTSSLTVNNKKNENIHSLNRPNPNETKNNRLITRYQGNTGRFRSYYVLIQILNSSSQLNYLYAGVPSLLG